MIDPAHVPPVRDDETVARFILSSSHVRRSNQIVKPDAFIPHPYDNLSVTRHRSTTDEEIWEIGHRIASQQSPVRTLYGRADLRVTHFLNQELRVTPDPTDANPNHAVVSGWPREKPAQKMQAMELASFAVYCSAT